MRICIQCDERFSGRSDKKFCSDYCRNQYNYSKSRYAEKDVLEIHKKMRSNHKILLKVKNGNNSEVESSILESLGYEFSVITGCKPGLPDLYMVYDISFFLRNNKLIFV